MPDPAAQIRSPHSQVTSSAQVILAAFDSFHAQFKLVARRAEARFETRDWIGAQRDATERLALYGQFVNWAVTDLRRSLAERARERGTWRTAKEAYARLAAGRADSELAYSFYNSVARRIRGTVGVEPDTEFTRDDFEALPAAGEQAIRSFSPGPNLQATLRQLLEGLPFAHRFANLEEDARLAAAALGRELGALSGKPRLEQIEVAPSLFYRNKGAYMVGRMRVGSLTLPLVLALVHDDAGIELDAVLLTSDEVSVVFSFTRSYFHVELERPRAMIGFLRSLMPRKPIDELYTSLGYHKHGKTELYQALVRHLTAPDARFEIAEGDKGLVMAVFALPSFNVVFKIIKDRFGAPKTTTREQVMEKYHLVFVRDRVGRLADAQEFEHLEFARADFAPALLEELGREAARTVAVTGDRVLLRHLYTERRVTPLNLYLKQVPEREALSAVLDYGQAIKDLAAANIFTGDMLLKNFGVTRHGRVIFYDYDELCLLTECHFRTIPPPRSEEDELASEPWFHVGERDVFPEEFRSFLLLPGTLGEAFLAAHGELLTVEFWRGMQERQARGEIMDFFPYPPSRRLRHGSSDLRHPQAR